MKNIIATILLVSSFSVSADGYSPYNQQFTMNQQYGSTNWYSSPLGMGVAQGGVALISGLVNMMSRPDPVVVPQQQQPVYVNQNSGQPTYSHGYGYGGSACRMQTMYDEGGRPQTVKVCQ